MFPIPRCSPGKQPNPPATFPAASWRRRSSPGARARALESRPPAANAWGRVRCSTGAPASVASSATSTCSGCSRPSWAGGRAARASRGRKRERERERGRGRGRPAPRLCRCAPVQRVAERLPSAPDSVAASQHRHRMGLLTMVFPTRCSAGMTHPAGAQRRIRLPRRGRSSGRRTIASLASCSASGYVLDVRPRRPGDGAAEPFAGGRAARYRCLLRGLSRLLYARRSRPSCC